MQAQCTIPKPLSDDGKFCILFPTIYIKPFFWRTYRTSFFEAVKHFLLASNRRRTDVDFALKFYLILSRDSLHHQSWWRSTAVFAPWSIRIVFLFCICIYVLVDDGQLHYLVLFYLHHVQVCKSKNCKSHHVQLELQKPAASRPFTSSSSNFEFEEYFPQFFANQSPIKVYLCLNPLTWWVTTSDLIDVTLAYLFPEC